MFSTNSLDTVTLFDEKTICRMQIECRVQKKNDSRSNSLSYGITMVTALNEA